MMVSYKAPSLDTIVPSTVSIRILQRLGVYHPFYAFVLLLFRKNYNSSYTAIIDIKRVNS